ncbi:MAG: hypothetical protein KBS95_08150 [Alistipes sp.]|nr:hypothetical protein [Candidatus Alistipes equi]
MEYISRLVDKKTQLMGRDAIITIPLLVLEATLLSLSILLMIAGVDIRYIVGVFLILQALLLALFLMLPKKVKILQEHILGHLTRCRITTSCSVKKILLGK